MSMYIDVAHNPKDVVARQLEILQSAEREENYSISLLIL